MESRLQGGRHPVHVRSIQVLPGGLFQQFHIAVHSGLVVAGRHLWGAAGLKLLAESQPLPASSAGELIIIRGRCRQQENGSEEAKVTPGTRFASGSSSDENVTFSFSSVRVAGGNVHRGTKEPPKLVTNLGGAGDAVQMSPFIRILSK